MHKNGIIVPHHHDCSLSKMRHSLFATVVVLFGGCAEGLALPPRAPASSALMRTHIDGLAVRAVACPIGDGALEVGVYDVCDYGWWEAQEAEDLAEGVGQTAENPYGMKLWPGGLALSPRPPPSR